jgi:hypothetical protein
MDKFPMTYTMDDEWSQPNVELGLGLSTWRCLLFPTARISPANYNFQGLQKVSSALSSDDVCVKR